MLTRVSITALILFNTCCLGSADDELQYRDGYCGSEAVRYVLSRFNVSDRVNIVRELGTRQSASIADLRRTLESVGLAVKSYACEAVDDVRWQALNRLTQSGSAIVVVLSLPEGKDAGHYFVLSDVIEGAVSLLDPGSGRIQRLKFNDNKSDMGEVFLLMVDHPGASILTRPPVNHSRWLVLPLVAVCCGIQWYYCVRRRSRTHVLGTLILLAAISPSFVGCDGREDVHLMQDKQNLGVFEVEDPIEAEFTVRNPLARPIQLDTLELGCNCLRTDFRPQLLSAGNNYTFHVRVDDKFVMGTRSQVGVVTVGGEKLKRLPFIFRYTVNETERLFPNPCFLGFVTSETLSNGVSVDLSLQGGNENDFEFMFRSVNIASSSGLESPSLTFVRDDGDRILLMLRADDGIGHYQVEAELELETQTAIRHYPFRILGNLVQSE